MKLVQILATEPLGHLVGLDDRGRVWKQERVDGFMAWAIVQLPDNAGRIVQICLAPSGLLYLLNASGHVYRANGAGMMPAMGDLWTVVALPVEGE